MGDSINGASRLFFGSGRLGSVVDTVNTTRNGFQEFVDYTLNPGVTLTVGSYGFLCIMAQKFINIQSTIDGRNASPASAGLYFGGVGANTAGPVGGAGGTAATFYNQVRRFLGPLNPELIGAPGGSGANAAVSAGGGGGGGGAFGIGGDGGNGSGLLTSGSGGSGGSGGGVVILCAPLITFNEDTSTKVDVRGSNGSAGGGTGGGGGGGGSGGAAIFIYQELQVRTVDNLPPVSLEGGVGGAGAGGAGGGFGGAAGGGPGGNGTNGVSGGGGGGGGCGGYAIRVRVMP